ncbi:MAG: hypothetical protein ABEJ26_12580 [Halosimplex sp.]
MTLTVANGGEGDGVFLAEVGDPAMSDQPEVAFAVPAGETRTATRRVRVHAEGDEAATVVLRWRGVRLERTLRAETATAE